ncbi:hypothetical protein [Escherichia coli]|uniref:hypothetical protein n=1 Tax=Escherichia coli TaxID=562 RepID=UPI001CF86194|nr:hypothetical protein [Escherichia coli]MCB4483534.1 hypothetical protein [Escherichia coli]
MNSIEAPLTDDELDKLIWGIEREGFHARTLSGLKELRERRNAGAVDLYAQIKEQAEEIALLRSQVLRVPMPVMVPAEIINQLENKVCKSCNDGLRGGCSSCAYRNM